MKDAEGCYMRLNRAFEQFFAVDRNKLIGKTLLDLLTPGDSHLHIEKDSELLATGLLEKWGHRVTLARNGQEAVKIIADIFLTTWERDIVQLRRAINNQDAASAECTAHSLKGTLAIFGADPAMRVATDLETRARSRDLEDMTPDIDSLHREIQLLEPHIRAVATRLSR